MKPVYDCILRTFVYGLFLFQHLIPCSSPPQLNESSGLFGGCRYCLLVCFCVSVQRRISAWTDSHIFPCSTPSQMESPKRDVVVAVGTISVTVAVTLAFESAYSL